MRRKNKITFIPHVSFNFAILEAHLITNMDYIQVIVKHGDEIK